MPQGKGDGPNVETITFGIGGGGSLGGFGKKSGAPRGIRVVEGKGD